jgi:hypothetical protein
MPTVSLVDFETASASIARLLTEAKSGPVPVAAFTDEELVALDGLEQPQVAPTLWLDTQPDQQREFAASVALRGLIARGLVARVDDDPEPPGQATGAREEPRVVLSLPEEVMAVLAMRRSAATILIAEQQTNAGKRARVLYAQPELGALVEDVNTGGLHTFTVTPTAAAIDDLSRWCDPDGVAGDTDGPPQTVALADYAHGGELPAALQQALAVTVLAAVTAPPRPGAEPVQQRISLYCLADHLVSAAPDPHAPGMMELARVSAASLRHRLHQLTGEHPA